MRCWTPNDCWNSCLAAVRPATVRGGAGDFLRGGAAGAGDFLRGSGGGALAGGLAAILLGSKTGRQIGGEVLKLGGMAAVGALAYKAWNDWQAGKAPAPAAETARASTPLLPPPAGTPFNPVNEAGQQRLARHLLRAMIAAAKSDGHVDAQEQARIFGEMDKLDLSSEDKAFVMDELRSKLDIDAVADAASSPEEAAEIYAASLLAIDVDNAAERGYLGDAGGPSQAGRRVGRSSAAERFGGRRQRTGRRREIALRSRTGCRRSRPSSGARPFRPYAEAASWRRICADPRKSRPNGRLDRRSEASPVT